ncbi:MAG: DinB family protein [Phototrophicaceae bacterium]
MITLDYMRLLWNYNYWAQHQLWECLKTVSQSDFEHEIAYGIGSLHKHAYHTMWAEALWLARIQNVNLSDWDIQDYPTPNSIINRWQHVETNWRDFIDHLTEHDLETTFIAKASTGTFKHTIGETMLHVVNHSTDHRAQMLRLIGEFGGQTFEQDIIFYLRAQQPSD